MFVWGKFAEGVDGRVVMHHALGYGVAFVPGAEFAASPRIDLSRWARFSFATLPDERFDKAVRRMAEALEATVDGRTPLSAA